MFYLAIHPVFFCFVGVAMILQRDMEAEHQSEHASTR
jgi:hypothetical protein